mmetsp:Transcript_9811/g.28079  ORF Transcript_9811/g.28079 Transcript_9811/m.28079 type:complete len:490 (-) Transcript_9811:369-1838(-)
MYKCQGCGVWSHGTSTGSSPRGYSLSVPPGWEGLFPMMPAPARQLPPPVASPAASDRPSARYTCASAHPSPEESKRLGRGNIHLFRRANKKFDIVGGVWYFLLVLGSFPRCGGMSAILDAPSALAALQAFVAAGWQALQDIFLRSHVSLAACVGLFLALLTFAKTGGIGVVAPDQEQDPGHRTAFDSSSKSRGLSYSETYRVRSGGLPTQALVALVHTATHLSVAICLMLFLDLGIETCVRHGDLGAEGYHSLYNWYRAFEAQHFPDPNGVRPTLEAATLHLYPSSIKWLMSLFDLPEAIALGRMAMCSEGGWASLSRPQSLGYYLGVLAYYWVLATPAIGFIFGCYLYVCVCWLHVHHDEGFSSMRLTSHKGFLRMHISREGKLRIWALAIDQVPEEWQEDPRWRGFLGGSDRRTPSYKAKFPSRWLPLWRSDKNGSSGNGRPACEVKVVDFLEVSKKKGPPGLLPQQSSPPTMPPLDLSHAWSDIMR